MPRNEVEGQKLEPERKRRRRRMIKELTRGNRRVVAFLKVEEHSALLAHMNEGGMAKHYAKYKHKKGGKK